MKSEKIFEGEQLGDVTRCGEWSYIKRDAAKLLQSFRAQKDVRFYRASLRADRRIYAYEGDKTKLLGMLEREAGRLGYEILAFALLDNELVLLLCKSGGGSKNRGDLLRALRKEYNSYYRRVHAPAASVKEQIGWQSVRKKDVTQQCTQIHRMAVDQGYVSAPEDFWWSSMNHFQGRYLWRFLNIWRVMANLSAVPEEALRIFREEQENGNS